jgi:hypothetical protein
MNTDRIRIGKDGAIAMPQRAEVHLDRGPLQRRAAKAGCHGDRRHDHQDAEHREHAAPAQEIADDARRRRAQEIAGHGAGQRAPDRNLPLFRSNQIAGQSQRDRKHAAGADAGENPRREQKRERRRQRAENVGKAEQHQAHNHQPRLAEQIRCRAQHRLHDGEGESEGGGKTRRGSDADAEIAGDMRQHRIERARRQARGKGCKRNDVQGRRHALLVRPQCRVRH